MMDDINDTHVRMQESPVPHTFGFVLFVLGLILVLTSSVTIVVLNKCTKLVFQVRFVSLHLTVATLINGIGITIIFISLYFVITGILCQTYMKCVVFSYTIYYLFLTGSGIDRLLSLKLAIKYTFWANRRNANIAAVGTYVVAGILSIPNVIENDRKFICESNVRDTFTNPRWMIYSVLLVILHLVQVVSYGYIGITAVKQYMKGQRGTQGYSWNNSKVYKGFWKVTVKSFFLCMLSALLIGPFIVSRVFIAFTPPKDGGNLRVTFALLIIAYIHQIVSPIFILSMYKECRYKFLVIVYHFSEEKNAKVEADYKQHYASYDIDVVSSKSHSNNKDECR